MEQSKQKINSVGRDNISSVGDKSRISVDNRQDSGTNWSDTLTGKVIIGVVITVIGALVVAHFKIGH